jgi:VIT1/CCC1 family predicted Fe2+/Mn2+ transporter
MSTLDAERAREHLQDELEGALLYDALADAESHPKLKDVYRRLAATERRHGETWRTRLREAGELVPAVVPSWRTRTLAWLARRFGPGLVLPTITSMERTASRGYLTRDRARDPSMAADETYHARVLSLITRSGPGGIEGSTLARVEGRHRAGGNALRAAVLGASDGLLSNLSLVMGVAGANLPAKSILLTGLAGLLAGAGSMALGEWLSVQSARELAESQIAAERDEIEATPEQEAAELALIFEAKGMQQEQARRLAAEVMRDPDSALDTLTREELGIDPESLGGSAWEAAIMSFILFAVGAIVPTLPFFFLSGHAAVLAGLGAGAVGLFVLGAGTSLFTGRGVLFSGGRQLAFGLAAAALTYLVGRLLGVTLAG